MGTEIERKYLVVGDSWRAEAVASTRIVQGYLASTDRCTVRVRVKGEKAFIGR
jgi:adenylate cyclase